MPNEYWKSEIFRSTIPKRPMNGKRRFNHGTPAVKRSTGLRTYKSCGSSRDIKHTKGGHAAYRPKEPLSSIIVTKTQAPSTLANELKLLILGGTHYGKTSRFDRHWFRVFTNPVLAREGNANAIQGNNVTTQVCVWYPFCITESIDVVGWPPSAQGTLATCRLWLLVTLNLFKWLEHNWPGLSRRRRGAVWPLQPVPGHGRAAANAVQPLTSRSARILAAGGELRPKCCQAQPKCSQPPATGADQCRAQQSNSNHQSQRCAGRTPTAQTPNPRPPMLASECYLISITRC